MPTVRIDADFQKLLPPLTPEESAELEASILAEGVREPLTIWQDTDILVDGHNRHRVAEKHGLPYRTTAICFADRETARLCIIRNQLARRNLKPDAASYLRGLLVRDTPRAEVGRPAKSGQNVPILQDLADETGVTTKTLQRDARFADAVDGLADLAGEDVRSLVLDGSIPKQETVRLAGVAKTDPELAKASVEMLKDLPANEAPAKALNRLKKERQEEADAELAAEVEDNLDRFLVIHSPIADLSSHVDARTLDAIITDPPYPEEYLPCYSDLSAFAARALKPGGVLLAMVGQAHLPNVIARLGEHLRYHWCLAYVMPGPTAKMWGRKVIVGWKPVLMFVNGDSWEPSDGIMPSDVAHSVARDKEHHEWGQSTGGMEALIEKVTQPGAMVCDPFCGGGATGEAAVRMRRYFIGADNEEAQVNRTKVRLAEVLADG